MNISAAAKASLRTAATLHVAAETALYLGQKAVIIADYLASLSRNNDWRANALGDCDLPSPLILDLNGDGVEADAIAFFDHEGDGGGLNYPVGRVRMTGLWFGTGITTG